MLLLDCETFESAINSVADILSIKKEYIVYELEECISEKKFEHQAEKYDYDFGLFILNHFINKYSLSISFVDRICWFHLARTLDIDSYEKGIYPLGKIIDKLFNDLYILVKDYISYNEWNLIKENGVDGEDNFLYRLKKDDIFHHGCYAMLVKEIAFHSKGIGNHDYLYIPEIVRDVSASVDKKYNINFTKRFIEKSYSIIVKFGAIPEYSMSIYLARVLQYIYNKINKINLVLHCNTCFDAKNKMILPHSIISIKKVDY